MARFPRDIRFTATLGTLAGLDNARFTDHVVEAGDTGRLICEHPNPRLRGWLIAETAGPDGERLFVPLHDGQFEEA